MAHTKKTDLKSKEGFTIQELYEARKYLNLLNKIKGTGLTMEIAENLIEFDKIGRRHDALMNELRDKFTAKDETGKPKEFKVEEHENTEYNSEGKLINKKIKVPLLDENGNPVEGRSVNGSTTLILKSDQNEYLSEVNKVNAIRYKLDLTVIPKETVKDLCRQNIIDDANIVSALVSIGIIK